MRRREVRRCWERSREEKWGGKSGGEVKRGRRRGEERDREERLCEWRENGV